MLDVLLGTQNQSRANQVQNYKLYEFCSKLSDANKSVYEEVNYLGSDINQYMNVRHRVERFLEFNHYKTYLFIFLIATISTFLFVFITKITDLCFSYKNQFVTPHFGSFLIFNLISGFISTMICDKVSRQAQGSGVPEMKTILTGVEYLGFFSWNTFIAKYTSIFFVRMAGFGVGFEGAFIHIVGILVEKFITFQMFQEFRKRNYKLIMIASISISFVLAFGAPIGGVI